MSTIILLSNDNEEFRVQKKVAEKSILIKNMIEDVENSDWPIPLPNVTSKILNKIIEWCNHHINDVYIDDDQEMLFDIILVANYLDIKHLLDIGCKTVTNMIKGKTAEEIRKENEWAEDR